MGHPVSGVPGGVSYAAALGSEAISGVQVPSQNGPLGPQGAGTPGAGLRQDHVAFLTLVGSTENPARDVAGILKFEHRLGGKGHQRRHSSTYESINPKKWHILARRMSTEKGSDRNSMANRVFIGRHVDNHLHSHAAGGSRDVG
ncbi:hypothetical protein MRX96_046368 [Rhipicephalus microplus]